MSSATNSSSVSKSSVYSTLPPDDPRRWVCVYPIYLNQDKTIPQGRKVPSAIAIDHPTVHDIADVCKSLSLSFRIEDKAYSRDFYQRGRVRVQLKQANGSCIKDSIPNRKQLLHTLCKHIPSLANREKYKEAALQYEKILQVDASMFMTKEEKKELERNENNNSQQTTHSAVPNKKKKKGRK